MPLPTRNRWILLTIISAVLAMVLWRYSVTARVETQPSNVSSIDAEYRTNFIRALAGAENSSFEVSLRLWYDLLEKNPKDQRVKFNYAVTAVAYIQDASQQIVSRPLQPKEIEKLRIALDATQVIANRHMADLKVEAFEPSKLAFLESQLYQSAASLEKSQDKSDKWYRDAANSITAAMAYDPASALLACEFDELVSAISDDDELDRKAAEALFRAWSAQPRNLFLTYRCGERLLTAKDVRLAQVLKQSLEIAKPSESMLNTIMKQPIYFEPWVGNCIASVEAQDWSEPHRVRVWLNLLRGCSGIACDARQIRPNVLALLDTTPLNDVTAVRTQGSSQGLIPDYIQSKQIALQGASAIAWYDHDVDTDFELVVATLKQLVLLQPNASGELAGEVELEQLASLEIDGPVQGILVADLFEADSQQAPRIMRTAPDLVSLTPEEQKKYDYLIYRHTTIQELVVWGPSGIRIIGTKIGDGKPELFVVQEPTGLESLTDVRGAEVVDIDSDCDLDLIVNTASGFKILQNNGQRNFGDISEHSSLPETPTNVTRLVACDFDRDMDQDIVTLSASRRRLAVLENTGHNQFRYREFGAEASSWQFSNFDFADFDGNRSWDWVSLSEQGGLITSMYQPRPFEPIRMLNSSLVAATGHTLAIGDFNSDSYMDLVAGGDQGLTMCLGKTRAQFGKPSSLVPGHVTALAIVDCDQNGGLDIASIVDGHVRVMLSKQPANRFIAVRVHGYNDRNGRGQINHYAIGSTIELASEDRIQMMMLRNPVVHFGLGASKPLNLRIILGHGLIKNRAVEETNVLIEERQFR